MTLNEFQKRLAKKEDLEMLKKNLGDLLEDVAEIASLHGWTLEELIQKKEDRITNYIQSNINHDRRYKRKIEERIIRVVIKYASKDKYNSCPSYRLGQYLKGVNQKLIQVIVNGLVSSGKLVEAEYRYGGKIRKSYKLAEPEK